MERVTTADHCTCKWASPPCELRDRETAPAFLLREAAATNARYHQGNACISALGYLLHLLLTSLDTTRDDEEERIVVYAHKMLDVGADPKLPPIILSFSGADEQMRYNGGTFLSEVARIAFKHPENGIFGDLIRRIHDEHYTDVVDGYYVAPFVWSFEEPLNALRSAMDQHKIGALHSASIRYLVDRTTAYVANANRAHTGKTASKTTAFPTDLDEEIEDTSDGSYALVLELDQRCACTSTRRHYRTADNGSACVSGVGLYCRGVRRRLTDGHFDEAAVINSLRRHLKNGDDFVSATYLRRPTPYDTRHTSPLEELGNIAREISDPGPISMIMREAAHRNLRSYLARRRARDFITYSVNVAPFVERYFSDAVEAVADVEHQFNVPGSHPSKHNLVLGALGKAFRAVAVLQDVYALKIYDAK